MYKIAVFFFCLLFSLGSFSQKIHCLPTAEIDDSAKEDLIAAYQDYIRHENVPEYYRKILLIDYAKVDSTSVFYILESLSVSDLFRKGCDCFFVDRDSMLYNHIAYVYTKQYGLATDSVWLQNILEQTETVLEIPKIIFHWGEKKYLGYRISKTDELDEKKKNRLLGNLFSYADDCILIEYKIKNKKIISKKRVEDMIYPEFKLPS